jgi:hypothetical protein
MHAIMTLSLTRPHTRASFSPRTAVLANDPAAVLWVFLICRVILCIIPTVVLLAVDPPSRHALRASDSRNRSA